MFINSYQKKNFGTIEVLGLGTLLKPVIKFDDVSFVTVPRFFYRSIANKKESTVNNLKYSRYKLISSEKFIFLFTSE